MLQEADLHALVNMYQSGRVEEFETTTLDLLEKFPQIIDLYNLLGSAYRAQKRFDDAIALFEKAIKLNPDNVDIYDNLAVTYQIQGLTLQCVAIYERALKIDPEDFVINNNLGAALIKDGNMDAAVQHLEKAIRLHPDFPSVYKNCATALIYLGEAEKAKTHTEKAIALNPNFHEAYYNLFAISLDLDDVQTAMEHLKKAQDMAPETLLYKAQYSACLSYIGQEDNAKSAALEIELVGTEKDKARLESLLYIVNKGPRKPEIFGSPLALFKYTMDQAQQEGLVLEFGVRHGTSIRQIASLTDQDIHGFDSFEGLPEDWSDQQKGSYTTEGHIPEVPDHVHFHVGWFDDTLPQFTEEHTGPVRFINVDCNLYSSTKTILDALGPQIKSGTVLVFDEYIGNKTWREDEFKAFQEAVEKFGWAYEYIAFSPVTMQVAVKIL